MSSSSDATICQIKTILDNTTVLSADDILKLDQYFLELECSDIPPNQRQEIRILKRRYNKLRTQHQNTKKLGQKDQLLDGAKDGAKDETSQDKSATQTMDYGINIMDKSKESLTRSLATIQETVFIGGGSIIAIENMTNQIDSMHDQMESIDSTFKRSTKVLSRIGRRIITDKYIWLLTIMVVIAIICIILLKTGKL